MQMHQQMVSKQKETIQVMKPIHYKFQSPPKLRLGSHHEVVTLRSTTLICRINRNYASDNLFHSIRCIDNIVLSKFVSATVSGPDASRTSTRITQSNVTNDALAGRFP